MRVHYKYIVIWVCRGLNPEYWNEQLIFTLPTLQDYDAVSVEALAMILAEEGPWTTIDILSIQAIKVTEQDVYVIKPVVESV